MAPRFRLATLMLLACAACDGGSTGPEQATPLWTAHLSHRSHSFFFVDGRIVGSDIGGVGAYDVENGHDAWYQNFGGTSLGGVAFNVGGRSVYVPRGDRVTAMRAGDGSRLWTLSPSFRVVAGGSDLAFAVIADSVLVALDAATGEVQWSAELPTLLHGGVALDADERGACVGLGAAIPIRFATRLACFELGGGEPWIRHEEFSVSNLVLTRDRVVGIESYGLVALDRLTGAEAWHRADVAMGYWGRPSVDASRIYVCDDDPDECVALELEDGAVAWRWTSNSPIGGRPALGDGSLYVPTMGGLVVLSAETGRVRAVIPAPEPEIGFYGAAAYGNGIVVGYALGMLYAYSAP